MTERPEGGEVADSSRPAGPTLVGVPIPRRRRGILGAGGITLAMAPMIDIVFLLLMYFLLVGEFLPPEGLFEIDLPRPLDQPQPAQAIALPQPPVRIEVRSTGDGAAEYAIALSGAIQRDVSSYDQLHIALESARGRLLASDQAFIIAPRGETRWEHTLGVFNAVLRAGYERIRFAPPAS